MSIHLTHTKAWLYVIFSMTGGMLLATLVFVSHPKLYLDISDSLNWRLGNPLLLQTRLETALHINYLRGDSLIDNQSILLLGDSHLHSFPTSLLGGAAVNYSIAGETAENLAKRVTQYKSLGRAKQIVLLTGRNDLRHGRSPQEIAISVAKVLDQIPSTTPVALVAIPPLRHAESAKRPTQETNHLLATLCANKLHCLFIDTRSLADASGSLRANFAREDGVHLTGAGYTQLAILLTTALHLPLPAHSSGAAQ